MTGGDTTFNSCTMKGNSAVSTSLRRLCVMFWKDASDLDGFGGCAVATTECEYESAQVVCVFLEKDAPDLDASPSVEKKTLKDLHQMFTGSHVTEPDLAQAAPPVETPTTESVEVEAPEPEVQSLEASGSDADVDGFLDSIETPTPPPKQDLESLLDDLGI